MRVGGAVGGQGVGRSREPGWAELWAVRRVGGLVGGEVGRPWEDPETKTKERGGQVGGRPVSSQDPSPSPETGRLQVSAYMMGGGRAPAWREEG